MNDVPGTLRAVARSTRGMVASPHAAASCVGVEILRRGSTAADAAIAANAVLAVIYPASCGIGGDLLSLVYEPHTKEAVCYNGSGRAAAALDAGILRERGYTAMPLRGALSVTVPGAVRAWEALLAAHGRLDLDELLAPAEGYARDGFAVTDVLAEFLQRNAALLRNDAEATRVLLAAGCPRAGDAVRTPELARTLNEIRRTGANAFYSGRIAEAIVSTLRTGGNPMTLDDLARTVSEKTTPVSIRWHGAEVFAHPPNSQGALAPIVLGVLARDGTLRDADWYHCAIEALKLAFDERDARFADPVAMRAPIDDLLADEAFARMRARIDPARARARLAAVDRGGTVGIVAVDGEGRAVSLLQSLFMGFGSGIVAPGTGVFLQNRGAYFSLKPGHPNELAGGKRPLHTLSPGMLFRNGAPELVYAAMGGDGQVQTHVQLLHAIYERGMDLQSAIDYPRFVYGRDSESPYRDLVRIESRLATSIVDELRARGHAVETIAPFDHAAGHAQAIAIDHARGTLSAGADPRADSAALGV